MTAASLAGLMADLLVDKSAVEKAVCWAVL